MSACDGSKCWCGANGQYQVAPFGRWVCPVHVNAALCTDETTNAFDVLTEGNVGAALQRVKKARTRLTPVLDALSKESRWAEYRSLITVGGLLELAELELTSALDTHSKAERVAREIAKAKFDLLAKADTEPPPPSGERKAG